MKRLLRYFKKVWKYKSFDYKKSETKTRNKRRRERRANLIKSEGKCRKCKNTTNLTIDHITPLSKGGSKHGLHNLQVLCGKCNQRKADKISTIN